MGSVGLILLDNCTFVLRMCFIECKKSEELSLRDHCCWFDMSLLFFSVPRVLSSKFRDLL
jgi:hypothetical protein